MLKRVLQSTPKYAFKNASTNNSIFVATTTHRPYAKKNDVKTNWHNALDDALFQDLERAIKGAASSPYVPATNNNKAPDDLLVNDLKTVLQQAPLQSKMQSVTRQFAKLEEPLELVSKSNNSALEQQIKFEDVGIHFPVPFVSAVQEWMQANPILQQVKNMTAMYRVFLSKSYVLEHCCLNNDEMKITSVDKLRQYSNIDLIFEGEALYKFMVSDYLMKSTGHTEGTMFELGGALTSGKTIKHVAIALGIHQLVQYSAKNHLLLAKNVESDALLALIAALKQELGIKAAREFVMQKVIPLAVEFLQNQAKLKPVNFIAKVEDMCKLREHVAPHYKTLMKEPVFRVGVYVHDRLLATGHGVSVQLARLDAASSAYYELMRRPANEKLIDEVPNDNK